MHVNGTNTKIIVTPFPVKHIH